MAAVGGPNALLRNSFLNRDPCERFRPHRLTVDGQRVLWKWTEFIASVICQIFLFEYMSVMLTRAFMATCRVQLIVAPFSVPTYVRDVPRVLWHFPLLRWSTTECQSECTHWLHSPVFTLKNLGESKYCEWLSNHWQGACLQLLDLASDSYTATASPLEFWIFNADLILIKRILSWVAHTCSADVKALLSRLGRG